MVNTIKQFELAIALGGILLIILSQYLFQPNYTSNTLYLIITIFDLHLLSSIFYFFSGIFSNVFAICYLLSGICYLLGAVHKWHHLFWGHFRHPPPPCHHVFFWYVTTTISIKRLTLEGTHSNHVKRLTSGHNLVFLRLLLIFNMETQFTNCKIIQGGLDSVAGLVFGLVRLVCFFSAI